MGYWSNNETHAVSMKCYWTAVCKTPGPLIVCGMLGEWRCGPKSSRRNHKPVPTGTESSCVPVSSLLLWRSSRPHFVNRIKMVAGFIRVEYLKDIPAEKSNVRAHRIEISPSPFSKWSTLYARTKYWCCHCLRCRLRLSHYQKEPPRKNKS